MPIINGEWVKDRGSRVRTVNCEDRRRVCCWREAIVVNAVMQRLGTMEKRASSVWVSLDYSRAERGQVSGVSRSLSVFPHNPLTKQKGQSRKCHLIGNGTKQRMTNVSTPRGQYNRLFDSKPGTTQSAVQQPSTINRSTVGQKQRMTNPSTSMNRKARRQRNNIATTHRRERYHSSVVHSRMT